MCFLSEHKLLHIPSVVDEIFKVSVSIVVSSLQEKCSNVRHSSLNRKHNTNNAGNAAGYSALLFTTVVCDRCIAGSSEPGIVRDWHNATET